MYKKNKTKMKSYVNWTNSSPTCKNGKKTFDTHVTAKSKGFRKVTINLDRVYTS